MGGCGSKVDASNPNLTKTNVGELITAGHQDAM